MRRIAAALGLLFGFVIAAGSAGAQPAQGSAAVTELSGLWLTTSYPVLTQHIGDKISVDLSLQNKNLPPRRVELSVSGLPEGWKSQIQGGGNTVGAAIVGPNDSQRLTLQLTPPDNVKPGDYPFQVQGRADADTLSLPISLTLIAPQPAKLTLEPKLPALRGTAKSNFDFQVTMKNDSAKDAVVNLLSRGPAGFQIVFTEQYGTQELTSLPVKAGESKDIKASVKLPEDTAAGQYPVQIAASSGDMTAQTPLLLDVTGQAALSVQGPGGRLSGSAVAGKERSFDVTLRDTGSAPAREVKLDATAPSGWKVEFDPATVPSVEAGQEGKTSMRITPSSNAVAGDYVVSISARGQGVSSNADFRVTVTTSTMWGIIGLAIIAAAVIVLAVAVARYGRR